eukprot:760222-Hanusia_phi.AAC.4
MQSCRHRHTKATMARRGMVRTGKVCPLLITGKQGDSEEKNKGEYGRTRTRMVGWEIEMEAKGESTAEVNYEVRDVHTHRCRDQENIEDSTCSMRLRKIFNIDDRGGDANQRKESAQRKGRAKKAEERKQDGIVVD